MIHSADILTDWGKFGTMLALTQWLSGGSLSDAKWQKATLFTLSGFTSYHLTTRNIFSHHLSGTTGAIVNDWIKVGTMFIVSQLLSGGSLTDAAWIRACLATLIGFTVYNLVTAKYVKGAALTYSPKLQMTIDDWAKFGTMLVVSQAVTCQPFNPKWLSLTLATLLGLSAYDLGVSHLVDRIKGHLPA